MEISILGPLRVTSEVGVRDMGTPAQRALLAVLVASRGTPLSDDRLVDELWGDDPPPSARHLLQVYASRLRAVLAETPDTRRIVREGDGYAICLGSGELGPRPPDRALPRR